MNKRLFHYAMAMLMATCLTACDSDDEDDAPVEYDVTLTTPASAAEAVVYTLPQTVKASAGSESGLELASIDITESQKIVVELYDATARKSLYVMDNVAQKSGDTYTISGTKLKGTVQVVQSAAARTRATGSVGLVINLTVAALDTPVTFATPAGTTTAATAAQAAQSDEAIDRLARTWKILGAIVDLRSDGIKAYEEFDSKGDVFDLAAVRDEAVSQGVSLTAEEHDALNRQIKSITFTRSGKFIVAYADGQEDVAEWAWANTAKTQIRIQLKDQEMGNKFLNDRSKMTFAFNGNRCNVRLDTDLDGENSEWQVALTFKLQSLD